MTLVGIEWSQGIEDAWSDVARWAPKLVGFLAILVVGWIVSKVIARIVDRLLERLGFDRAFEHGGLRQMMARSQYEPSDIVSRVVYYLLLLVTLSVAFSVFGANPVSDMLTDIINWVPRLVAALIIVVVAMAVANIVRDMVSTALSALSYGRAMGTAAWAAVVVIGVFAALSQLEIAPAIVNGLFYAVLAVVCGSAIVAIGGGGIQPMRQRWENALRRYDEEKPRLQQQMQSTKADADRVQAQGQVDMAHSEAREQAHTTP
jgi:hypothetical protein